jgi:hypothetical protein
MTASKARRSSTAIETNIETDPEIYGIEDKKKAPNASGPFLLRGAELANQATRAPPNNCELPSDGNTLSDSVRDTDRGTNWSGSDWFAHG